MSSVSPASSRPLNGPGFLETHEGRLGRQIVDRNADIFGDRPSEGHTEQAEIGGRRVAVRPPVACRIEHNLIALADAGDAFADHVDHARTITAQRDRNRHPGILPVGDEQFTMVYGCGPHRDTHLSRTGHWRDDFRHHDGFRAVDPFEIKGLHGQPFLISCSAPRSVWQHRLHNDLSFLGGKLDIFPCHWEPICR